MTDKRVWWLLPLLAVGVWTVMGGVSAFALMIIAPLRSPDFLSLSLLVVPAVFTYVDDFEQWLSHRVLRRPHAREAQAGDEVPELVLRRHVGQFE